MLIAGGCSLRADSKPESVRLFPPPGTAVASPESQITLRGGGAADVGTVTVTGSASGTHEGRMQAHSDGQGVSFVAEKPFQPGETVTVSAGMKIAGAGESGATFTVARPAEQKWEPGPTVRKDWEKGALTLKTHPELRPSSITATTPAAKPGKDLLLLTPHGGPGGSGPQIMDDRGNLVWYQAMPSGVSAADLRVQTMAGKPVLTYWKGTVTTGMGRGEYVVLDKTYTEIATIDAGNGYTSDLHDMRLTEKGTAWIMIYTPVKWDLSPAGGPADGIAIDNVVQEIDVATGAVLFEWHSLDHVGVDESVKELPKTPDLGYDYFHINSLDVERGGTLLLSARNTSALYRIDATSGEMVWRLGGKKSDFSMAEGATFGYQHDARQMPDGTIMLFDNAAATEETEGAVSAALRLKLDDDRKTATVVARWTHPTKLLAASRGSVQRLENGNTFVGWGSKPFFTEYDASGNVVFDARMDPGVSYRTYRMPWTGRPAAEPALSVTATPSGVSVWVSWNGDTETATWELLAGDSVTDLKPAGRVTRTGFETELTGAAAAFVAVRALDASGQELIRSQPRAAG
ncbi:MAG TPA: arylsulfotransferase family protein [Actinomycetota bacterium]|nr:arylsulfotransferase family protein [Actinomycetota bacterium]